jgi:hypothetical protein
VLIAGEATIETEFGCPYKRLTDIRHTSEMLTRFLLPALAATLVLVAASPSVAQASTPCWKKVHSDWTKDGKIDGHYSPACLRQAIKHVQEDQRDYSPIVDDINAALLAAIRPKSGGNDGTGGGTNPGGSRSPTGVTAGKNAGAPSSGKTAAGVPSAGTPGSVPDSSRSLPLPLIILGALALAAALAAVSPPLLRRLQTRFPRLPLKASQAPDSVRRPT